MMQIANYLENLEQTQLFKDFKEQNPESYLSHFFSPIKADFSLIGWEVGFYSPQINKITVFKILESGEFEIKPADDVFTNKPGSIEKLEIDEIKLNFGQALDIYKEKRAEFFTQEAFGDGFIILQKIQQKNVWNFTFITKSLKFANIKLDAGDGKVVSHEAVELVQK